MTGLVTIVSVLTACAPPPPPPDTVITHPADPASVHGTDRGDIDRLAATVVTDVQQYWAAKFPETFGRPWHDLDGGFFSVDTTRQQGKPPPCSGSVENVEGNAYYCATVDAVAWDRAALLPVLRERYGEGSVVVVLAHELGHAVQQRSGTDVGGAQHREDPVRVEASADCYAGSFVRWVADGHSPRLRISPAQLDDALHALIVFRDPITSGQQVADAHGTSFDRMSAFQDGYQQGPGRCADVTETAPASPGPGTDRAELGGVGDIDAYFADVLARRGGRWTAPHIVAPGGECTGRPVAYCSRPPAVAVDRAALADLHHDIGDQASPTLIASRYALAALAQLNRPITGAAAGEQAVCLTGAFTGSRGQRDSPPLSPGDLDEAVETLLSGDSSSRDADGTNHTSGFDRVASFRAGVTGGDAACGI